VLDEEEKKMRKERMTDKERVFFFKRETEKTDDGDVMRRFLSL